jgi:hypothetical protein
VNSGEYSEYKTEEKPNPPPNPFSDDYEQQARDEQARTIGEYFQKHLACPYTRPLTPEEIIYTISYGEFDTSYLSGYKHTPQLTKCIHLAVEQLSAESYLGCQSHANVMWKAMELLRSVHNLNAPKGWVPVMKHLRKSSASFQGEEDSPWARLQRGEITEEQYAAEVQAAMAAD